MAKKKRKIKTNATHKKCIHCGKICRHSEGCICDECYSRYTPAMLADLEP